MSLASNYYFIYGYKNMSGSYAAKDIKRKVNLLTNYKSRPTFQPLQQLCYL